MTFDDWLQSLTNEEWHAYMAGRLDPPMPEGRSQRNLWPYIIAAVAAFWLLASFTVASLTHLTKSDLRRIVEDAPPKLSVVK